MAQVTLVIHHHEENGYTFSVGSMSQLPQRLFLGAWHEGVDEFHRINIELTPSNNWKVELPDGSRLYGSVERPLRQADSWRARSTVHLESTQPQFLGSSLCPGVSRQPPVVCSDLRHTGANFSSPIWRLRFPPGANRAQLRFTPK